MTVLGEAIVNAPRPLPPRYRLLDTVPVVEDSSPHWGRGVQVHGYPVDMPESWTVCLSDGTSVKVEGGVIPLPIAGAFTIYLAETCTARGIGGNEDQRAFIDRAYEAFDAVESWAVEREFAQGRVLPGNPFLADSDAQILASGTPQEPRVGLSYLANAIGMGNASLLGGGRRGLIHATPGIVESWGEHQISVVDGKLQTAGGINVVNGTGYIDTTPVGSTTADPENGIEWAFATSLIEVRRGERFLIPGTVQEAMDRETNTITYRVERTYLVNWDATLQAAVAIDWTL